MLSHLGLILLLALPAAAKEAPQYIGSDRCADCHQAEASAWKGSDHDLAWTLPDEGHLLGDFDHGSLFSDGVNSRMFRKDGVPMFETEGPDGDLHDYPVKGVVGIRPLQQYLLETEPGRLQVPDISWDTEKQRWYDLYPDQVLRAGNGLHWTGPYKTWNARCAECHATGYSKAYDPDTRSYHSTQAEIGVGCEACHGPGSAHADWAEAYVGKSYEGGLSASDMGLTADLRDRQVMIQQCAGCHSRREALTDGNPVPGTPFHDAYRLSLLRGGMYYPDGQIREEVYVYGSFLQSKMYAKGVSCTNCHDPHTDKVMAEDNSLCTQCHSPAGNPDFPSLPLKEFDSPAHHFHEPGSPGAQCRNCHMPERVYMGTDWRRDHSFRIPRPDLDAVTGAPDACTSCHKDRSPDWAAAEIRKHFPDYTPDPHPFGVTFARAQDDPAGQASALSGIALYDGLPGIVRASAVELLAGAGDAAEAGKALPLLKDPDPLVRAAAVELAAALPPEEAVPALLPLIRDPMKAVRIATARAFLSLPLGLVPEGDRAALGGLMSEWQQSLWQRADFPETQLVLAGIGLTLRKFPQALAAFEQAVTLDPQLVQAWSMIARIHEALGDLPGAKDAYDRALKHNPGDVDLLVGRGNLP